MKREIPSGKEVKRVAGNIFKKLWTKFDNFLDVNADKVADKIVEKAKSKDKKEGK